MSQGADKAPARPMNETGQPVQPAQYAQAASEGAAPPVRWLPQTASMPVAPAPTATAVPAVPVAPSTRGPRVWERVVAAAAHLLMLASLPGLGLALIIWLTQRKRSAYVAMQAKDAVLWQVLSNAIFILLLGVLLVIATVSLGGAVSNTHQPGGAVTELVGSLLGIYIVLVVAALFFGLSAIVGALFALLGLTFHYPLVGRRRKSKD